MIIETKWFVLQGPRRADLSGRPFGFLLIWLAGTRQNESEGRFAPIARPREFGFFLPLNPTLFDRWRKIERFECHQLAERDVLLPHDWSEWPVDYRNAALAAAARELGNHPGRHIAKIRSFCDRRADLASRPLQMTYEIILKKAA